MLVSNLHQFRLTSKVAALILVMLMESKTVDPSIQMRALRWALGENFKAMPSEEVADRIGIPPQAIRAVESRRRKLSPDDQVHIALLLGAVWSSERKEWITTWDETPFTRTKYELYQNHLRSPDFLEQARAEYHRMVDLYLDRLEPLQSAKIANVNAEFAAAGKPLSAAIDKMRQLEKQFEAQSLALTKLYRELQRIADVDPLVMLKEKIAEQFRALEQKKKVR